MAPAMNFPGIPSYLCGHNLLKAHAEVVHMYRNRFQPHQNGKMNVFLDIFFRAASWHESLVVVSIVPVVGVVQVVDKN